MEQPPLDHAEPSTHTEVARALRPQATAQCHGPVVHGARFAFRQASDADKKRSPSSKHKRRVLLMQDEVIAREVRMEMWRIESGDFWKRLARAAQKR